MLDEFSILKWIVYKYLNFEYNGKYCEGHTLSKYLYYEYNGDYCEDDTRIICGTPFFRLGT